MNGHVRGALTPRAPLADPKRAARPEQAAVVRLAEEPRTDRTYAAVDPADCMTHQAARPISRLKFLALCSASALTAQVSHSTRTMHALAGRGMAPAALARVDAKGRPVWCIAVQLAFGLLAYIGEAADGKVVFGWLLSISGMSFFFVWGSICLTHIRFRHAWAAKGYTLERIPYRPVLGVWGSYVGFGLNVLCILATIYHAIYVSVPPFSFFFFLSFCV